MRSTPTRSVTASWLTPAFVALLLLGMLVSPASQSQRAAAQDASESPAPSGSASSEAPAPSGDGSSEVTQQLPPAELPTGNLRQLNLQLDSKLDANLDDAPTEADVYSLSFDAYTSDQVSELADAIGLDGDVEDRGNDTFVVSGKGELFVSPQLIQYQSSETPTLADLPNDEDAVAFARDWLQSVGLAPADLGDGTVSSRTEAVGRVSVAFKPRQPDSILTDYPTITVVIGPDGVVLEAGLRWAQIAVTERYLLRPAEDAWQQVEAGDAYIEASFNDQKLEDGAEVTGTATYRDVSVAYTTAGSVEGERYLVPVYVFVGDVEAKSGAEGKSEIRAYVPAIVTNDTPVG